MDWKVGDIAICINVSSLSGKLRNLPPLVLYQEYKVLNIQECSCGSVSLDVGLNVNSNIKCSICDKIKPVSGIWWCNSKRFTKRLPISAIDALISEIMEKSPPEEIEEKSEETTKV